VNSKSITLIRAAPDSGLGSMAAYAQMVRNALESTDECNVNTADFFDPAGGSMRRHHLWRLRHARTFFSEHPSDLYHLLDGSMAGFLPSKVWKKTIVTVHDLIPLLQMRGVLDGNPGVPARLLIHRMVHVLQRVAGVASVSHSTAKDLMKYTGRSDVTIIHNPVRSLPTPADLPDLPERFIFHIGNNADYKNRVGVLNVFERLQDIQDLHLIMAGPKPTLELRRKAEVLERVRFQINPSDAQLSILYKKASAFLFPSKYEGFGMPVLEAMAAGCPVICSNAASLPEVVGKAAYLAPSEELDRFAKACRDVLENPSERDRLRDQGYRQIRHFSVEQHATNLQAWYRRFLRKGDERC
jgi:glycosyltransferase involved in cell wall biosynthesis